MRKRFLLLFLCLCLIGVFTTACGGGGKTTIPSDNSSFYYLLAQQNANNEQPAPEPTPEPESEKYPLELSQTEFTLNVGATDNITVTLNGEDITETAIYTVEQEAIARVEQGVITGLSVGVATVTVHSDNAEEDKTFTVNVVNPTLPTLEVSKSELSIIVGGSEDITVSLEGKPVTEGLKYDVQDEEVAKVENGKVTALAKGSTTVTVSLEGANSAVFTVETFGKGDSFQFGSYPQTSVGEEPDIKWPKQPIEWKILDIDTDNNRALLLSLYGLDAKRFDDDSNVWKDSEICSWLNSDNEGGFYDTAFNETEKGKINPTKLSDVDSTGATYNVFLLSGYLDGNGKVNGEVGTYFADDKARQCLATAYAKKHGAYIYSNGYCYWWLLSPNPDYGSDGVYCVRNNGFIDYCSVRSDDYLVRPALWINL